MTIKEDKLLKIQNEIMEEMDKEANMEKHIMDSSEQIASQLMSTKKITTEINGTPYMFSYRVLENEDSKFIFMLVANTIKYKIAQEKYKPFKATAEMDLRYSLKDNLQTVVETFIRHITGHIKPTDLEDDEDYLVKSKN